MALNIIYLWLHVLMWDKQKIFIKKNINNIFLVKIINNQDKVIERKRRKQYNLKIQKFYVFQYFSEILIKIDKSDYFREMDGKINSSQREGR